MAGLSSFLHGVLSDVPRADACGVSCASRRSAVFIRALPAGPLCPRRAQGEAESREADEEVRARVQLHQRLLRKAGLCLVSTFEPHAGFEFISIRVSHGFESQMDLRVTWIQSRMRVAVVFHCQLSRIACSRITL
eukprot:2716854-Rhodomonas_salina.2